MTIIFFCRWSFGRSRKDWTFLSFGSGACFRRWILFLLQKDWWWGVWWVLFLWISRSVWGGFSIVSVFNLKLPSNITGISPKIFIGDFKLTYLKNIIDKKFSYYFLKFLIWKNIYYREKLIKLVEVCFLVKTQNSKIWSA